MIPVSQKFKNAALADVNKPSYRARLVLGNYASAAAYGATVVSSGDFSSDYPAAGAIDGDRTEINVGPASGADNDLGKSSWRSSGIPDNGDTVTLDVTFSQSRTINRIKLYHLAGAGLKTYKLSWWDGAAWNVFAATSDVVVGGQTSITTTNTLDTIDFPDVTTTKVRLQVFHTVVASGKANVVEIEVYRLLDISDNVKGWNVTRGRDFKLVNPMATQLTLMGTNGDRFFSMNHAPTAAEVASGFVNQELRPGIGIIMEAGFDTFSGSSPELVTVFIGTADSLTLDSKARNANIAARDGMKALINKTDSTKLKTSIDIGDAIRYVLNRANVSNYEMSVDTTSIVLDYFFSDNQNALTAIQDLAQAAGDSTFYFDENGIATFKDFSGSVPLQHIYTSNSDFLAGTLAGNMQVDVDQLDLVGANIAGETNNGTGYTAGYLYNLNPPSSSPVPLLTGLNSIGTRIVPPGSGTINTITFPFKVSTPGLISGGSFTNLGVRVSLYSDLAGLPHNEIAFVTYTKASYPGMFTLPTISTSFSVIGGTAYWIVYELDQWTFVNNGIALVQMNAGAGTWTGASVAYGRSHGTSATATAWAALKSSATGALVGAASSGSYTLQGAAISGTWTSPVLDTGALTTSYGLIVATTILGSGTISYQTASSADGISFDPFVAASLSGQINSVVRRYLKIAATLNLPSSTNPSPVILDITVNWVGGGGSAKYPGSPSSLTFNYTDVLLEVQQEIADNLGGDSSILNDVTVQAQPLVLTGADADTVWQGTIGTPPTNVSGSVPMSVTNGQIITIAPVVGGGMDISRMSGANPAAGVVTFGGGATGSWVFSSIHPTRPILVITITNAGNITDLRITGKKFSNASYLQAQNAKDAASIALYGDRQLSISNDRIVSTTVAATIAAKLVANSKAPTSYIPSCRVRPNFAAQLGDRVTVVDYNLDMSGDYVIANLGHDVSVDSGGANVGTTLTLLKVPAGL